MKKFIALIMTVVMTSGLVACASGAPAAGGDAAASGGAASGDTIRIGVFEPSTGDSASGGKKDGKRTATIHLARYVGKRYEAFEMVE